jgi:hypothetical protein
MGGFLFAINCSHISGVRMRYMIIKEFKKYEFIQSS